MPPFPSRSPPAVVSLPSPLFPARFLFRPNRFVVHACLEDQEGLADLEAGDEPPVPRDLPPTLDPLRNHRRVACHMADPGRLRELLIPGRRLLLRHASDPHRTTRWSVVLVEGPGADPWVSVDTTLPNRLVGSALESRALEELEGWELVRREFPHQGSRLDFQLERASGERMALEVKSVTLVEGDEALFPDAVTSRGARHVRLLAELAETPGWEAAVLFVLQRSDAKRIRAAREIDPDFADALARARAAGVRVLGRRCRVSPSRVVLGPPVPAE